ncbi:MAG: exosortase/archaeosortase family protein [Verrucomicrobiota bacterium]
MSLLAALVFHEVQMSESSVPASPVAPRGWKSFTEELSLIWRRMPNRAVFLGLLGAWVVLFVYLGNSTLGYEHSPSLLWWLYRTYTVPNSEDSHGLLVPLIVLALFWWKRKALLEVVGDVWGPGLGLLAAATALHVIGYMIQQPRVSVVAFLGGVWALLATAWGRRFAVASLFPFGLLIFCIPVGTISDPITVPLRRISTDIAVAVVRYGLGIHVLQTGVQIVDPKGAYSYEVVAACSGIRSLVTLLALTTIYGFTTFVTGWKRALMVVLALPLALAGNVVRLVAIILAAEAFGHRAGELVHEYMGFVTFVLALLLLFAIGHWLREPDSAAGPPGQGRRP